LHGSLPGTAGDEVRVGRFAGRAVKVAVSEGAGVGETSSVLLGRSAPGVWLGTSVWEAVSVGGIRVSVGRAACVSANAVNAPAIDVLCISCRLTGEGVAAGALHELASRASRRMMHILIFIPGELPYLMTILSL
jgi:hypothetical protein